MSKDSDTVTQVLNGLGDLTDSVTAVKEDLDSVKSEMGTVKTEQIEGLTNRITSFEDRIKELEGTVAGVKVPHVTKDSEIRDFQFMPMFHAIKEGGRYPDGFDVGWHQEVHQESSKISKALNTGVGTAGGFLVAEQFMPSEFIELLRARMVVLASGARRLTNLMSYPIIIPKQTGGGTFAWKGEGQQITNTEQTFGQLELTPHAAKMMTRVSNRMLRMAVPQIEGIVRDDLAAVMARGLDNAAINENGGGGAPIGIISTSGINTKTLTTTSDLTKLQSIKGMILELAKDNSPMMNLGWVTSPQGWDAITNYADSDNRLYFNPNPSTAPETTLFGFPVRTTTQVTIDTSASPDETDLLLVDWSEFFWAQWAVTEFAASDEAGDAFEYDETWIRIITEVDFGLRHEVSACHMGDLDIA